MATSEDKKSGKKQVFDVAKPGKTPAAASARPIIVTHKPMVEDPMVSKNLPADPDEEKPSTELSGPSSEAAPMTHGEKVLAPLHEEVAEEPKKAEQAKTTAEESKTESEINDNSDSKTETASETPASNDATPSAAGEQSGDSTAADINTAAEELNDKKVKQVEKAKQEQEELERQQKVAKLIEEKKYYVKVGETRKRKSASVGIILLVLLLVVTGLYLAVDAELIQTDISLPYDFIKK